MMHILLPTDFSENAFNAARYSLELLKDETCVFYLLHTYTPPIYRVDYAFGSPGQLGLPDDHQYVAEAGLDKFRTALKETSGNPRHTFVTHSAFNTLADEIKKMVENENIDLIIMGTQGATGAKEIFFGSNTVHVLKNTIAPVLAVPAEYTFEPLKNILFPTDFEIDYQCTPISLVLDLARKWEAQLHVLHVAIPEGLTNEQKGQKKSLEELLTGISQQFHNLPDQELILALDNFQQSTPIDLLVMVQNTHNFFERLFIVPTIQNIGLHTQVPFMVLPYQETLKEHQAGAIPH